MAIGRILHLGGHMEEKGLDNPEHSKIYHLYFYHKIGILVDSGL